MKGDYRYEGFRDPIQKITGDAYSVLYGLRSTWNNEPVDGKSNDENSGIIRRSQLRHAVECRKNVVELLVGSPGLKRMEIKERLEISSGQTTYALHKLIKEDRIVQIGNSFFVRAMSEIF